MIKVLFVCLGNICRSPMAQIIFENMIQEQGLENEFEVDSAGTEGYNEMCHAGIHRGTKEVLRKNGVYFKEHYSRKIRKQDYAYYDYIIAMDSENISDIEYIVGEDKDNKIKRLLDYTNTPRNIKDPWYTGNFDETYDDVIEGCSAFLEYLKLNSWCKMPCTLIHGLCKFFLVMPYDTSLNSLIHEPTFINSILSPLVAKVNIVNITKIWGQFTKINALLSSCKNFAHK